MPRRPILSTARRAAFPAARRRAQAKRAVLGAGAHIDPLPPGAFDEVTAYIRRGSFSGAEAWERFGEAILARPQDIDARIAERILRGRSITAADLEENRRERAVM